MLEGALDNLIIENNKISCTFENTPTLKVIKQGEFGELLPNAKFTITDEQGNSVIDGNGNEVGQVENIDGQDLKVITTDENGQIVEKLEPGTYILTEVQAPEGYKLPENEEDRKTIIEITSEGFLGSIIEKGEEKTLWDMDTSWIDYDKLDYLNSNFITNDGNFALVGVLYDNLTIPAEYTESGEEINIEKQSNVDGIIIIYDLKGRVKEVRQIHSLENSENWLYAITQSKDGTMIALGDFSGIITIPAGETVNNQEITINSSGDNGVYMICYNTEGKVAWLKNIEYLQVNI